MPVREGWLDVPFEPDPETATRLIWLLAALSFLLAIVSGIGEWLGWWDLIGELGMTIGGVAGVVLTAIGIFSTSSRRQVADVHWAVIRNGRTLSSMDGKLDVIEDALVEERGDGHVSRLDAVQIELDRQTGVLDRQLSVLGEIRDAL